MRIARYLPGPFENEKYLFMGFCGGALNAIHAAANEKRVHGVINVAAPIALSAKIEQEQLNPYHSKKSVESYKKKLLNRRSLLNFVTGKSEYGVVLKSIYSYSIVHLNQQSKFPNRKSI